MSIIPYHWSYVNCINKMYVGFIKTKQARAQFTSQIHKIIAINEISLDVIYLRIMQQ